MPFFKKAVFLILILVVAVGGVFCSFSVYEFFRDEYLDYRYRKDFARELNEIKNTTGSITEPDEEVKEIVPEETVEYNEEPLVEEPRVDMITPPDSKILKNDYHVFQTFNNCGPASFSMALSYYGVNETQENLGKELRPYQHPKGDNDDKTVTIDELAKEGEKYGFLSFHRPNGNIEMIKYFITYDIPVIAKTWLKPEEDIGHFRVIKGYDDNTKELIQDDSLQGKNLRYTYDNFNELWKRFGYEFLVLVPKEKADIAKTILGENYDYKNSWEIAVTNSEKAVNENPDDIFARFNLVVAYYNVGKYQEAVNEYEKISGQLPFRTLWYQIEPIKAYYELGNYEKVFEISDYILNNNNRAYSELYLLRGDIYYERGQLELAKSEYEKALYYNTNLEEAKAALQKVY